MKKTFFFLLVAFFAISAYLTAAFSEQAADCVESFDKGNIDWTTGIIRATGIGLAPADSQSKAQAKLAAQRAAKVDAYRRLAEIVQGVRVSSETTVQNFMLKDTTINTRVSGFIKGARETEIKYYADGAAEVTIEASLNGKGGLADIILPALSEVRVTEVDEPLVKEEAKPIETAQTETAQPQEADKETEGIPAVETTAGYTGLVVNAKGLGIQPSLSPKILTEEKEEVYGINYADPRYRTELGLVEYHTGVDAAKQDERVTKVPYIIQAVAAAGPQKSDVIIKTADAQGFGNSQESKDILQRCRVIIVLE